jgi:hypothetical protein
MKDNFLCVSSQGAGPIIEHEPYVLTYSQCLSRIPDPKTATKEKGEKKFDVIPFYVATNFTKLYIILVLKCRRTKFGPIFKEL